MPLRFVSAPALRSGNEIQQNQKYDLDPRATVVKTNPRSAVVKFAPSTEKQKEYADSMGTPTDDGLGAQFVVQYDVERDPNGGEVSTRF